MELRGREVRTIGHGEETFYLSESDREAGMHILGSPREGKSKFIEHLVRGDIDRGLGVCVLDPSAEGDTIYKILRYCASIGHDKVFLVDPNHRYKFSRIPAINPFHCRPSLIEASVSNMMDTMRTVFGVKDPSNTNIIEKYLPALFSVLHYTKLTFRDVVHFTDYDNPFAINKRAQIFDRYEHLDPDPKINRMMQNEAQRDFSTLQGAFKNTRSFDQFGSTVRRMEPVLRSKALSMILGMPRGADFVKMVADGWVILVNLDTDHGLDKLSARLLGTIVINEVISAILRLRSHGWKKMFYLYIDEAGEYANDKVADVLDLKPKIGLRLILAHQYLGQFEDASVRDSIKNSAKLKVAFYVRDNEERLKIVKMMYGGKLEDRDVSQVLSGVKKQYAVIQKPKDSPHIVRIPDVPSIEMSDKQLDDYIKGLYNNPKYPWYYDPKDVVQDWEDRFNEVRDTPRKARANTKSPKAGAKADKQADSNAGVPARADASPDFSSWDEEPPKS